MGFPDVRRAAIPRYARSYLTTTMLNGREPSGDAAALGEFVSAFAAELGFDLCGFAPIGAAGERTHLYAEWLDRDYHGTMDWMEKTRALRMDAGKLLPGAKSMVCVAMNYYTEPPPPDDEKFGKISRYARFRDYHKVLRAKLKKLLAAIEERYPGAKGTVCVDTKPVLEKAFAEAAGLGWIGKNTCLLTKKFGSYVFLGEVILNAELPYGRPHADHCGTCAKCIDACPTQAIVAPYIIDARRCISYLTIETRAAVPRELEAKNGAWVFGCDVCQEVCPWNARKAKPASEADFIPREALVAPELEKLAMTLEGASLPEDSPGFAAAKERFSKLFSGTPVMRAGAKRMAGSVRRAIANAAAARAAKGERQ